MIRKIAKKIKESKSFLITAHVNVEGDAVGSELAMYAILKKLNKKVVIFNQDITPETYSFMPFHRSIRSHLKKAAYDVALVLDCSDSSRSGIVKDYLSNAACVINIDHHISNTQFGDLNWVDGRASSTCEMIYKLSVQLGVIDKNIALCLYTGISTDTGNFTYSCVTPATHKAVAHLLHFAIDPQMVYQKIHSLCQPADLRFIASILSSLKFDAKNKICWVRVDAWKEKQYDLAEIVFSLMRLSRDAEVLLLFKKTDQNKVRVNFRSRSSVDVNKIARVFGGGGHKRASGATLTQDIRSAERKVISLVKQHLNV